MIYRFTPLLSSILNENYDILKTILTKYKNEVDINCRCVDNLNALHLICSLKPSTLNVGQKMLFAMKNLSINDQETSNLNTPLHLAIMSNNMEIVKILLNYPNIDINIKNSKNFTPFHAAMNFNFWFEAKEKEIELSARSEIIKLFFNSKKEFDIMSSDGVFFFFIFFKMLTL